MVRPALPHEFLQVRDFYWTLIDGMRDAQYLPGWQKGIYPTDEFLRESLDRGELFVLERNGQLVGAMVVNHQCNEGYAQARWAVDAQLEEISVIHALGVLPACHGQGLAKELTLAAVRMARERGQRAVRLDVLGTNLAAKRLYEGLGFQFRKALQMYYDDTGWTEYLLYELPL